MKLKLDSIYLLFIVAAIGYFSIARSANPPNGRTGAPGDGLCLDCHSGGGSLDGDISINGVPATIMPSTTYRITVTANNPNGMAQRAGFQLVALDNGNLNTGTMSNPSASSALEESGGRTYFEHRPAVDFPASNQVNWEVDWLSPTTAGETITFYTAGLVANGSGSGGDRTVLNTAQGTIEGTTPDPPVAMVTTTNSGCNGDNDGTASVTVTDGTPPFQFLWSNGAITQTISNLAPGPYSVTVTDGETLADSDMGVVGEPAPIITDFNITNASCNGESNGGIDLEISGGNNSFTYLWSNGAMTEDLEDIPAGVYSVTVSDAPSCVRLFTDIIVGEPDELTAIVDVLDVDCNGNENGEIAVTPSGGTAPFTYDWSDGAPSNPINEDLEPGTYSVTVTDVNLCSFVEEDLVVAEPDVLVANAIATNETSAGAEDGTATASPVGGNAPYFYLWSNGANTPGIMDLTAGPYTVTVTDNKNCISTETVVVQAGGCDIMAEVNTVPASCTNSMDGNAIVILTGGDAPFRYIWSNGDTTQMVDNLASGDYQVTVTDVNDCIAVAGGTVGVLDTQSPIANGQGATIYLDANGNASITSDQINDGSIDNCGSDNLSLSLDQSTFGCDNLGSNTVILMVTDVSGNSDTASVTVTVIDTIPPVLSCQGTVLATECDAVSYNIPTASDNCTITDAPVLVSGIPSGDIFPVGETEIVYTVSDASGNPTTCSFIVRVNPGIEITVDSIMGSTSSNDGGIFVTVTGGSGSFSYEWMDSDNVISTEQDLINVGEGFYELKVIDDSTACVIFSDSIEVGGSVGTIDRVLDNAVNIYPNPATDFIQIEVNGIDTKLNIEVMSLSGNVMMQQSLLSNNESINIDHLSTGLYFVKIFDQDRFTVRKILVK